MSPANVIILLQFALNYTPRDLKRKMKMLKINVFQPEQMN